MRSSAAVAVLALIALPVVARASCDPSATATYGDVDFVRFVRYATVGPPERFVFEAFRETLPRKPQSFRVALVATRGLPFQGKFDALDPRRAFDDAVNVLRLERFYDRHFAETADRRLDGPEDQIVVARCGVETRLGSLPRSADFGFDLRDLHAPAFVRLETDLQDDVVHTLWSPHTTGRIFDIPRALR